MNNEDSRYLYCRRGSVPSDLDFVGVEGMQCKFSPSVSCGDFILLLELWLNHKGQLISKGLFGVIVLTKKAMKCFKVFCPSV